MTESFMKRLNKSIKAPKLESLDWTEEFYIFMLSHRTTPHRTTTVASSQLLFNREVKNNIPSLIEEEEIDCKDLHGQSKKSAEKKQQTSKTCIDMKRKAKHYRIVASSKVLIKQQRRNKFT